MVQHGGAAALALAGVLALASMPAGAAPIVQVGSSYNVNTRGGLSGFFKMNHVVFDGVAEHFERVMPAGDTAHLTVSEEQVDLGGGQWRIRIVVDSDQNLYPIAQNGEFGGGTVGMDGDPLDFLEPVRLLSAHMGLRYADGSETIGPDWLQAHPASFGSTDPWNGCFLDCNRSAVYGGAGQLDTRQLNFEFLVAVPQPPDTALPEPNAALLGLAGLALLRRAHRPAHHPAQRRAAPGATLGPT